MSRPEYLPSGSRYSSGVDDVRQKMAWKKKIRIRELRVTEITEGDRWSEKTALRR